MITAQDTPSLSSYEETAIADFWAWQHQIDALLGTASDAAM